MTNSEMLQNICANIRWLRTAHGLSRSAMAKTIHVSLKTLDSIESGVIPERCGIRMLFHIHRAFRIPPQAFVRNRLGDDP